MRLNLLSYSNSFLCLQKCLSRMERKHNTVFFIIRTRWCALFWKQSLSTWLSKNNRSLGCLELSIGIILHSIFFTIFFLLQYIPLLLEVFKIRTCGFVRNHNLDMFLFLTIFCEQIYLSRWGHYSNESQMFLQQFQDYLK